MPATGRHLPGFLKLFLYRHVYVCVCVPSRLLITSGVIWSPNDWLNKFYSCYMAKGVVLVNGHGINTLQVIKSSCTRVTRQTTSVIRVGVAYVNVCISRRLKEELARAIDKQLWLIIYTMLFKTIIPLRICCF